MLWLNEENTKGVKGCLGCSSVHFPSSQFNFLHKNWGELRSFFAVTNISLNCDIQQGFMYIPEHFPIHLPNICNSSVFRVNYISTLANLKGNGNMVYVQSCLSTSLWLSNRNSIKRLCPVMQDATSDMYRLKIWISILSDCTNSWTSMWSSKPFELSDLNVSKL